MEDPNVNPEVPDSASDPAVSQQQPEIDLKEVEAISQVFDYRSRVVMEKAVLEDKILKLATFIMDEAGPYGKLDVDERNALKNQANWMRGYADVLAERISRF